MKCSEPCCEHQDWQEHSSDRTTTYYVCCHCGRQRTEVFQRPLRASFWANDEDGHGPHKPSVTVRF
jgi:hypothetical protein